MDITEVVAAVFGTGALASVGALTTPRARNFIKKATEVITVIDNELTPNAGKSAVDKIEQIKTSLTTIYGRLNTIHDHLVDLESKVEGPQKELEHERKYRKQNY